jgi:hypothetical protein
MYELGRAEAFTWAQENGFLSSREVRRHMQLLRARNGTLPYPGTPVRQLQHGGSSGGAAPRQPHVQVQQAVARAETRGGPAAEQLGSHSDILGQQPAATPPLGWGLPAGQEPAELPPGVAIPPRPAAAVFRRSRLL